MRWRLRLREPPWLLWPLERVRVYCGCPLLFSATTPCWSAPPAVSNSGNEPHLIRTPANWEGGFTHTPTTRLHQNKPGKNTSGLWAAHPPPVCWRANPPHGYLESFTPSLWSSNRQEHNRHCAPKSGQNSYFFFIAYITGSFFNQRELNLCFFCSQSWRCFQQLDGDLSIHLCHYQPGHRRGCVFFAVCPQQTPLALQQFAEPVWVIVNWGRQRPAQGPPRMWGSRDTGQADHLYQLLSFKYVNLCVLSPSGFKHRSQMWWIVHITRWRWSLDRHSFLKLRGLKVLTFSELQPLSSKLLLQGGNKLLLDFLPLWRTRATLLAHVQPVLACLTLPSICALLWATKRHKRICGECPV